MTRHLQFFAALQIGDFATTAAILSRGGTELNPIVAAAMGGDPMIGLAATKCTAVAVAAYLAMTGRNRLFGKLNRIYGCIVIWNLLNISVLAGLVAIAGWITHRVRHNRRQAAMLSRVTG